MNGYMAQQITCTVSGRVQMVMYRDFAQRKARSLGLVGVVKNQEDGTVRVVAEGDTENLKKFISLLRQGPLFAKVEDVQAVWTDAQAQFSDFRIVYRSFLDRF